MSRVSLFIRPPESSPNEDGHIRGHLNDVERTVAAIEPIFNAEQAQAERRLQVAQHSREAAGQMATGTTVAPGRIPESAPITPDQSPSNVIDMLARQARHQAASSDDGLTELRNAS